MHTGENMELDGKIWKHTEDIMELDWRENGSSLDNMEVLFMNIEVLFWSNYRSTLQMDMDVEWNNMAVCWSEYGICTGEKQGDHTWKYWTST